MNGQDIATTLSKNQPVFARKRIVGAYRYIFEGRVERQRGAGTEPTKVNAQSQPTAWYRMEDYSRVCIGKQLCNYWSGGVILSMD